MNLVRRHGSRNSTNPCITIVDGDTALALALSDNLKTEGYVVESVDRGDEAVKKLADAPPDLVILDWMSPGISGPEICTRLRAEEATRMLPIIMLSREGKNSCACVAFPPGRMIFVSHSDARADRARACFIATQPVCYCGPGAYPRRSSIRPPDPKGPPGLARRPSRAKGIPAARMFARAAWSVFSRQHLLERVWGPSVDVTIEPSMFT